MFFSAHLFDSNMRSALRRTAPTPADTPGLRSARTAVCTPFDHSWVPAPQFKREAMLACWHDEAALDSFLADNPLGRRLANGWYARLELVRRVGIFPGLVDSDFASIDNATDHDGPSVAFTLGTAYLKTFPSFFKVNKGLERQFLNTPSGMWGTAMVNPQSRFVATLTFWDSLSAATEYVRTGAHGDAARTHYSPAKDPNGHTFVTDGGFLGFKPLSLHGSVGGKNPITEMLLG